MTRWVAICMPGVHDAAAAFCPWVTIECVRFRCTVPTYRPVRRRRSRTDGWEFSSDGLGKKYSAAFLRLRVAFAPNPVCRRPNLTRGQFCVSLDGLKRNRDACVGLPAWFRLTSGSLAGYQDATSWIRTGNSADPLRRERVCVQGCVRGGAYRLATAASMPGKMRPHLLPGFLFPESASTCDQTRDVACEQARLK